MIQREADCSPMLRLAPHAGDAARAMLTCVLVSVEGDRFPESWQESLRKKAGTNYAVHISLVELTGTTWEAVVRLKASNRIIEPCDGASSVPLHMFDVARRETSASIGTMKPEVPGRLFLVGNVAELERAPRIGLLSRLSHHFPLCAVYRCHHRLPCQALRPVARSDARLWCSRRSRMAVATRHPRTERTIEQWPPIANFASSCRKYGNG